MRAMICRLRSVIAGATVTMVACSAPDADTPAISVVDSAGIAIVTNDLQRLSSTCSLAAQPDVTIGSAQGQPEYELYRVFGASRLQDDRIVLVNQGSQEIRFFDGAGRFLSRSGRAGRGPGEFADAFYLWVLPGDTIWVGDYRPWQFLVFSPDGEYVRTVRPRPEYANSPDVITVLDDGRSVLAERQVSVGNGLQFETRMLTLVIHAPDGRLTDTVGTWPNGRWGRLDEDPRSPRLYPLFESFTRVDAAGRRIVVGHGSREAVTVYDAGDTTRIDRIIRWSTGVSREITAEAVAAERERLARPYEDADPAMRRQLVEPLISEQRPVADVMPAFQRIAIGRDGRIWIRPFHRSVEAGADDWIAFDTDGRFACTSRIPPFDEVLEFGADYILVLIRDDLGVEHVARYRLDRPAAID